MRRLKIAALLLVVVLTLAACLGPKPVVQDYTVQAPTAGSEEPYKVEVVLSNGGPGEGEVLLVVELSNKETGELLAQEEREINLASGETIREQVDLELPESARDLDRGSIEVSVDAHYPIE